MAKAVLQTQIRKHTEKYKRIKFKLYNNLGSNNRRDNPALEVIKHII